MAATLRLIRSGVGIELRRGRFEVTVDGRDAGSLDYQHTFETTVEPGQHTVRLRVGRYSSRAYTFDVADGAVAAFRCHGAMVWPRYVASLVKPDLAIALMRE